MKPLIATTFSLTFTRWVLSWRRPTPIHPLYTQTTSGYGSVENLDHCIQVCSMKFLCSRSFWSLVQGKDEGPSERDRPTYHRCTVRYQAGTQHVVDVETIQRYHELRRGQVSVSLRRYDIYLLPGWLWPQCQNEREVLHHEPIWHNVKDVGALFVFRHC